MKRFRVTGSRGHTIAVATAQAIGRALPKLLAKFGTVTVGPEDLPTIGPVKALRLKRAGIRQPLLTAKAARAAGLALPIACALLMQETSGGRNEWGHDPTIFVGGYDELHHHAYGELVTEAGYRAYLEQRGPDGAGGMQGVGPCQLTYWSYQDLADRRGGCWSPYPNMLTGFGLLAGHIRRVGLRPGIAAYNGTGPAAQRYAASVLAYRARFAKLV